MEETTHLVVCSVGGGEDFCDAIELCDLDSDVLCACAGEEGGNRVSKFCGCGDDGEGLGEEFAFFVFEDGEGAE